MTRALHTGAASTPMRSGIVALGTDGVGQLLRLAATVLVASYLGPDDYALWTLLGLFTAAAIALDEGGLHQTLIVRGRWSRREATSVFWVSATIGVVIALLLPGVGALVPSPAGSLAPYLAIFALTTITSTVAVVPRATLSHEFRFLAIGSVEVAARAVGAVVTIALAIQLRSVWALLVGVVVQRVVEQVLLFRRAPFRPDLPPTFSGFAPMAGLSRDAIGVSMLGFASTQMGVLVVAVTLDDTALGIWGLATTVFVTAQSRVATVISKVALPTLSSVPDDQMSPTYLRGLRVTTAALSGSAVLMALLTPFLVDMALGDRWRLLVPVAALLVPAGIARGIGPLTDAYLYAQERANLAVRWELVRLPATVALMTLGALTAGVVGVAAATGPLLALGIWVRLSLMRTHLHMDLGVWLRSVAGPLGPLVAATAAALCAMYFLGTRSWVSLVATAGLFCCTYLGLVAVVVPELGARLVPWRRSI